MRERGKPGAVKTKVITPGKIVPSKCCLPSSIIGVEKDFDTDVPFYPCHTFTECGLNVHKQAPYLIDKAILGKMGGIYVTYVADADEGQ